MKRLFVFMIIGLMISGMISAQGIREGNNEHPQRPNINRGDMRPNANPETRRDRRPDANSETRRDRRPEGNHEMKREHRPDVNPSRENNRPRGQNSITISGILKLENGCVAIQNEPRETSLGVPPNAPGAGSSFYLVPMLNRYIGFIDGLRENARVTIEGNVFRNIIHPTKLTIGNRSYDFPAFNQRQGANNFQNRQLYDNSRQNRERPKPNN